MKINFCHKNKSSLDIIGATGEGLVRQKTNPTQSLLSNGVWGVISGYLARENGGLPSVEYLPPVRCWEQISPCVISWGPQRKPTNEIIVSPSGR